MGNQVANPAEPVNGQDERAAPAVDSPACPCWWVIKGRQPKMLPPFTIIKGNYQPATALYGGKGEYQ